MSASQPSVDVRKVSGRRELHFQSLDDIEADIRQLSSRGQVRSLGNWSPGQIFQHLAKSFHLSIDGSSNNVAWPLRTVFRLIRSKILTGPMKPGIQLPVKFREEFEPDAEISDADGRKQLLAALDRLKREHTRRPSPAFGELTEVQWTQLHCRHSELHLSFLVND